MKYKGYFVDNEGNKYFGQDKRVDEIKTNIDAMQNRLTKLEKEQKTLWKGALYMQDTHTANLNEKISAQKNGIVLMFSGYDGTEKNYNWTSFFIPKIWISLHQGSGVFFSLGDINGVNGFKYLYINDNNIKGHANNKGTHGDYNNSKYVLRYVFGI